MLRERAMIDLSHVESEPFGRKRIHYMTGKNRADIKPGLKVAIVLKQDQRSGKLTEGVVKDILTKCQPTPTASRSGWKAGKSGG